MELEDMFEHTDCFVDELIDPIKLSVNKIVYYTKGTTVYCKMFFKVKGPSDVLAVIDTLVNEDCYEVTAEAKVAPGDTFDLEIGKKVARAKAESMAYRKLFGCLRRLASRLLDVFDAIDEFGYKADAVCNHNEDYLSTF